MAVEFDLNQPFEVVEGETLDSLIAPRPRAPVTPAPSVVAPVGPTFDPSLPFTPVTDAPAGPTFDPSQPVIKVYGVEEFTAKPAEELVADKDFMPIEFGKQFETTLDPAQRTKLEQVYAARESAGTSVADKVKAAFTGIFPAVKTLTSGVKSAAKLAQKFTPAGVAQRLLEKSPQEVINDYAKSGTEAAASVELAALGSTDLLRRSTRAVGEAVGLLPGDLPALAAASGVPVRKAKADMTEGDWRKRLSDDIAAARQVDLAGQGNGEVMRGLGIDAATLEKDFGIQVDPEEIARLSVVTDPINYVPLGATVGWIGKIGGKFSRGAIAATRSTKQAQELAKILNTASQAASVAKSGAAQVAGGIAKTVGGAIESIGNVAEKGVRALGGTASGVGLGGLLGGDVYSALGGAAVAKGVPRITQAAGRVISGTGRILTGEAVAPAALTLAGDTLKAGVTGGLKGAAEGSILILPFEIGARPEEEEQLLGMVGLGAGLRGAAEGVRPGARAAGTAAQNKLAESIFRRVEQEPLSESPTYGTDPLLDSTHAANVSKLAPSEQKLVNWGRELLRAAGGEVYVLDNAAFNRETGSKTAHGYAVNIGEKIAPDGSVTPVFRILLNQSAEAMPHEFFHALTELDPKRAASFRDTVKASLTPDQLKSFEQLYNSRLNNGLPEVQWKKRLTPEQVANEAAAETFSRLFLAQDLTGVAPKVQQKAALFVSSLLEKLGAPLGKVGAKAGEAGVSTLGVRPGAESAKAGQAWIANLLQRVNDEGTLGQPPIAAERPVNQTLIPADVVRAKPVPAKPTPVIQPPDIAAALRKAGVSEKAIAQHLRETGQPPVPVPPPTVPPVNPPLPAAAPTARNVRTTRAAQDDFAGRRAEVTNVDSARQAAEATGDANTITRVSEISDLIESGSPVIEIEHSGARSTEQAAGRTTRRAEQEAAYIAEGMASAPQPIREAYQKVFVPVRWEVVAGKPQLLAMSLDKVIANTHKSVKEATARGVAERIPYEITDGRLTDNAWGQFVDDLKSYAENQSNGYRGDGQKLTRPTTDVGLSIPAENPAYNPRPITEERANFINLVQGLNPPLTAREVRGAIPGNVKGQILAETNLRTPQRPSVIRPEDIAKQEFKSQPGRSIAETNPLRNELAAAGVPVRELIEVTERINARDINSVRSRPELEFKAPVTDIIRGGFLPATPETIRAAGDFLPEGVKEVRDEIKTLLRSKGMEDMADFILQSYRTSGEEVGQYVAGSASGLRGKKTHILLNQKYLGDLNAVRDTVLHELGHVVWELTPETDRNRWTTEIKNEDLSNFQASASPEEVFTESFLDWMQDAPSAIRPDLISDMVRAEGDFMPTADVISDVLKMDAAAFNAAAKSWEGGQRNRAYDLGLSTKSLEEVALLKDAQERASADRKRFMAAKDVDNGVASALKAQFFREAYEAATDTGGAAGEIGWRQAFPDRQPPFPEQGNFLPGEKSLEQLKSELEIAKNKAKEAREISNRSNIRPITDLQKRRLRETAGRAEELAYQLAREVRYASAPGEFLPRGEKPMPGSIEEYDARVPRKTVFPKAKKPVATSKQSKANPTAWILPDGEVRPLTETYHEDALATNAKEFNKKFGTNFAGRSKEELQNLGREEALNAGFVRMRHVPNTGTMRVEIAARHWKSKKSKLLDTLLSHSEKIDNLFISLSDENGNSVDSITGKVFDAEDRVAAITGLVDEIIPPKVTRARGVGPSDIQRMRALPGEGDFLPAPAFYSELQRVIDEKVKGDSIPATQLAALVRNAGVKPEELKWSGLDDYLAGKSKVSVPELKKFLRENEVQLEEVEKGAPTPYVLSDRSDGAGWFVARESDDRRPVSEVFADRSDALDEMRRLEANKGIYPETKFENYQVPGGENYRELLLTLPEQQSTLLTELPGRYSLEERPTTLRRPNALWQVRDTERPGQSGFAIGSTKQDATTDALDILNRDRVKGAQATRFKSSHFDEPNVLAHVRFNERRDAAGKKVLFLEEVQSDWHQKGKREGYKDDAQFETLLKQREGLKAEFDSLTEWFDSQETQPGYELISFGGGKTRQALEKNAARVQQLSERLRVNGQLAERLSRGSVPDAPFKKTWPLLAVKRMLRYAAENGFDKLAWTPGEIQAARYDLSKQVDSVSINRPKDGTFQLSAEKDGSTILPLRDVKDLAGLEELVGKDLAQKAGEIKPGEERVFEGVDLKVGGEGMRGFYDQILPKEVGAYVKKWGAKVERIEFENARNSDTFDAWSVTLTPSMRTDVLTRGQKMFLPSGEVPMFDLGLPSEERMKQLRVKTRVSKARDNFPEALVPQYQEDAEGGFVLGEDGKPKPIVQDFQSLLADTERTESGQLRRKQPQNELAFSMKAGDIQKRK